MRFRRLKLSGFKSFVEPAELRIEPGLTGVVGPNGCGKSNLLEAIRWVMGESSPKSLRGGGMEDVIFAGTATRPPRDFAEVILSAHDSAGEELEVVRRIERGAGSAYRINGRDARQKDVALVFADAATGAHSPALVSQGRIAAVINARPAERRAMLEEAAGIAGLHVRRRDAEQKLRATEANLARLEDLMSGLEARIAGLRRQARTAERYRHLSEQIRVAEARVLFARWREAAQAADHARAEAKQAEECATAAQARADAAQTAQAKAAQAAIATREALSIAREAASANTHRLATLNSQWEAAQAKLTDLDRQQARLEADRSEADRLTHDAAQALQRLQLELDEARARLAQAEAERPAMAQALQEADSNARAAEIAYAQANAEQARVEAEWRVAEAEIAQARTRCARAEADLARNGEALAALDRAGDPLADLAAATARRDEAGARLTQAREKLNASQERRAALLSQRDAAASALSAARADLAGIEREFQALQRDRETRAKAQKNAAGRRLALDHVRAAPGYERALAAVLGRDAKAPLGEAGAEGRFWTGAAPPVPVAQSLAAHVPDCPEELAARLALVWVDEDDDGRALAPGEWLVTRAGHVRRWDGFVARGEGAAEAARMEADNRFLALEAQIPPLREALARAEAEAGAVAGALAQAQNEAAGFERDVAAAVDAERAALRAMDAAEAARDRAAARRAELQTAALDLTQQRDAARGEQEAALERRSALPAPDTGRAMLEAARLRHEAARSNHQSATALLATQDQNMAVARERVHAQSGEIRNWQNRASDAAKRLAQMAGRIEEIAQERAVHAARPAAIRVEMDGLEQEQQALSQAQIQAESAMTQAGREATEAERELAGAQEALLAAREARAGALARSENENERRAEFNRASGERFQCPPPLLPPRFGFAEAEVGAAGEESRAMDRWAADRERLGPVNLVAAQELAAAEERAGESIRERAELAEAVNRLRGSIGNLNREGRERLRAAFEAVDGHFRRLFTTLFQGGQAHLALVDSDDPLEAGLEIFAQPPGKRLQSLTLLSGGEQALTAVALIFALFLTNPSPICVLDEVDAPLDDANIERFCDLLEAMTRETETRYLVVTHNAVTMSRMHRLFGVTMVERGVSRLVSVDLSAAEQLLAEAS
ncbi:chromosome segregation SMC family protein [Novosphingobium sediminicola]|uniref:Chromosome partition protein Smc n=1 Tax=Novosphingobium sediminicola TaxID=563162 RepID=A0A7W6G4J5_9SPHN|nr:AAA family ATPase [Novosphingobium sediminicola]MBB3953293.1 chromosome segregation protein [Novosphingobium sediminicola]